ncbi:hypothetical protein T01_12493 [Trichinella spiralis]|uniref:Uncharacterized protein n=1 Tax=Trichinella spiralis TaxID=6334 RepID=A0A0V1APF6_TRISP|nr:hypothetical protein T01_12493 [Trichinella spiralis]
MKENLINQQCVPTDASNSNRHDKKQYCGIKPYKINGITKNYRCQSKSHLLAAEKA